MLLSRLGLLLLIGRVAGNYLVSQACTDLHICTDDGSYGYHGFVTGKLENALVQLVQGHGGAADFLIDHRDQPVLRAGDGQRNPLTNPNWITLAALAVLTVAAAAVFFLLRWLHYARRRRRYGKGIKIMCKGGRRHLIALRIHHFHISCDSDIPMQLNIRHPVEKHPVDITPLRPEL